MTAGIEGRLTGVERARAEQVRDRAAWGRDVGEKSRGWSTDHLGSISPLSSTTLGNFSVPEFPHSRMGKISSFLMEWL